MKKLMVILFLALNTYTFCQTSNSCGGTPPVSRISDSKSKNRVHKYMKLKNAALYSFIAKNEIDTIPFSKKVFVELLDSLTSSKYDGFRVYFATYPVQPAAAGTIDSGSLHITQGYSDCFTLIFVPTTKDAADTTIHHDDTSACYIINNDKLEQLGANNNKFLSQWIQKYRTTRMIYLDKDGNGHVNKGALSFMHHQRHFFETESLWYSGKQASNGTNGLLDYIQCDANNVTSILVKFAAYLLKSKPWSYQLTLVFGIESAANNFLGKRELLVSYKEAANSDTGKPCPPPTICPTVGAVLPIQQ